MTESRNYVRVLLYGCSHKPKFSGMSAPKKGDLITCYVCRRGRRVTAIEGGWKYAEARCRQCQWRFQSEGAGKKRLVKAAQTHANARGHRVGVDHDGSTIMVYEENPGQIPLIDDLLLP
jgi:hypothetical protein